MRRRGQDFDWFPLLFWGGLCAILYGMTQFDKRFPPSSVQGLSRAITIPGSRMRLLHHENGEGGYTCWENCMSGCIMGCDFYENYEICYALCNNQCKTQCGSRARGYGQMPSG